MPRLSDLFTFTSCSMVCNHDENERKKWQLLLLKDKKLTDKLNYTSTKSIMHICYGNKEMLTFNIC